MPDEFEVVKEPADRSIPRIGRSIIGRFRSVSFACIAIDCRSISRAVVCSGMELFIRRVAAIPGDNGVLLSMDFIYQVAISYRQATRGLPILIEHEQAFSSSYPDMSKRPIDWDKRNGRPRLTAATSPEAVLTIPGFRLTIG